jgi:protein involved in polysaccharide export with SLBB domain
MKKQSVILFSAVALSLVPAMPLCASGVPKTPEVTQAVVTIGGQVRRPGPVPFRKDLTIYAAVQAAGGATEFGSMRRVKVIRDGTVETHDLTKDDTKSLLLQKNDTIEVPQKTVFGR